uniref:Glycosyltransferase 2-like domain-containing protein n=1 Tax=viral metagenome TaxID=1070528 RepID=A0A6C0CMK9_9ZZZZ
MSYASAVSYQPSYQPPVYVSLTTIPSRIHLIRDNLTILANQTYKNCKGILLIVPENNMRGFKWTQELPAWLQDIPNLQVVRPKHDRGPIMKYIGAVIENRIPTDSWMFVCDDDIEYKPNAIQIFVDGLNEHPISDKTIVSHNDHSASLMWVYGVEPKSLITGFAGVLVNQKFAHDILHELPEKMTECCSRIDDDVVTAIANRLGYVKYMTKTPAFERISQKAPDPLNDTNRIWDRHVCHSSMNEAYAENTLNLLAIISAFFLVSLLVMVFLVGGQFTPIVAIPAAILLALGCGVTSFAVLRNNFFKHISKKAPKT